MCKPVVSLINSVDVRTAFVHVGLPKTGTTSLQKFLARNLPLLKSRNFDFRNAGSDPRFATDILHLVNKPLPTKRGSGTSNNYEGHLWSELNDSKSGFMLMSSEYLVHARKPARDILLSNLRDGGYERIFAIVTSRDLGPSIGSLWAQSIRTQSQRGDFREKGTLLAFCNSVLDEARGRTPGSHLRRNLSPDFIAELWSGAVLIDEVRTVADSEVGSTTGLLGGVLELGCIEWYKQYESDPVIKDLISEMNTVRHNRTASLADIERLRVLLNIALVQPAACVQVERAFARLATCPDGGNECLHVKALREEGLIDDKVASLAEEQLGSALVDETTALTEGLKSVRNLEELETLVAL